ncbi:hypothetical protein WKK05_41240 (plasmid) [Nostoc sp. UHCC 0302]|uniref:hypothetical protein n=1 Tax=Nostoc sp. UHCC 0302 TaxID=3134896 RepID=UPI00311CD663
MIRELEQKRRRGNFPERDEILAIVVLISVVGLFTLALIDPSARSTFADLAKVTVGAYIGLLMPKGGGK